jgi:hypothetical protein
MKENMKLMDSLTQILKENWFTDILDSISLFLDKLGPKPVITMKISWN